MDSIVKVNAPENIQFPHVLSHAVKIPGLVFCSGQVISLMSSEIYLIPYGRCSGPVNERGQARTRRDCRTHRAVHQELGKRPRRRWNVLGKGSQSQYLPQDHGRFFRDEPSVRTSKPPQLEDLLNKAHAKTYS